MVKEESLEKKKREDLLWRVNICGTRETAEEETWSPAQGCPVCVFAHTNRNPNCNQTQAQGWMGGEGEPSHCVTSSSHCHIIIHSGWQSESRK